MAHFKAVTADRIAHWLRILPHMRAYPEKYNDQGLIVIGLHTEEFGFEKNLDNIRCAMKRMRIDYPVAIESNYAVWNADCSWFVVSDPERFAIAVRGRSGALRVATGVLRETELCFAL